MAICESSLFLDDTFFPLKCSLIDKTCQNRLSQKGKSFKIYLHNLSQGTQGSNLHFAFERTDFFYIFLLVHFFKPCITQERKHINLNNSALLTKLFDVDMNNNIENGNRNEIWWIISVSLYIPKSTLSQTPSLINKCLIMFWPLNWILSAFFTILFRERQTASFSFIHSQTLWLIGY